MASFRAMGHSRGGYSMTGGHNLVEETGTYYLPKNYFSFFQVF